MINVLERMAQNLMARVVGPLHFRIYFQPIMASILGIRDGIKDAHEGNPVYFWTILSDKSRRISLIKRAFKNVLKIFALAILLDAIYQIIDLHWFYPGEALLVALILAFIPYVLVCSLANRGARLKMKHDLRSKIRRAS
jgi:hypothetical protein